ncbi:MAG TPA: tagaturonate epimerase family protein [Bacteroidales bacterium]|nr:tagaturonate epimerase family protein [Bacteroidales bacterium]
MKILEKYSIGMGDRFGHQGSAQLKAVINAGSKGIDITPVWNKSNREHTIIGTNPGDVRIEADTVIKKAGFKKPYFVDADHINLDTVDRFIESSDFFTIDVASYIGKSAEKYEIEEFLSSVTKYTGTLSLPGTKLTFKTPVSLVRKVAEKYLFAAIKAWDIYRQIEKIKGNGNFIVEVSMDEVPQPQTPVELFFILKMLALENIPLQTIAPKFSGRFNKGVDYVGDIEKFRSEFEADLLVIDYAIHEFGLPGNLKMSIHSGSDKFKIYPVIGSLIRKYDRGIHLKTAGTTWLEEIIGLAESGGEGLVFAKDIYIKSLGKIGELTAPYADVIDIKVSSLPSENEVSEWSSTDFADALRHNQDNIKYNSNMRQLLHVAYKLAAERMDEFYSLLDANEKIISRCVYENMYKRHICRLFDIE